MITQAKAKANWASLGPVLAEDFYINYEHTHTKEDIEELGAYLGAAFGMIGEKLYRDAKQSSDGPIAEMQEPFREMFSSVRDAFLELIGGISAQEK